MAVIADGWEIVATRDWEEVYDKIEANAMHACKVKVGEKTLLFCLEPKIAAFDQEEARVCAASLSNSCRTCMHRMVKFSQFIGSEGKHIAFCQKVTDDTLEKLRKMRDVLPSNHVTDYRLIVIDEEFRSKYPTEVGPFNHVHFTFDQLTPEDLTAKLKALSAYCNGSFENRFQRLVDDSQSLQIIKNELPNLVRPDHWKAVTNWAVGFVAKAKGRMWGDLAAYEKFEVMTYALLTGRSEGSIHFDMQQAGNLLDFMDDAHDTQALRAMMDDRSNPETYQVSRVAELLRDKAVTSLCTVTLVWGVDGQPHQSDLDLHTKVNGKDLYYGNKRVGNCTLDFDANASKVEKNPAENISLNQTGTFVFHVDNFNNRDGKDIPFEVTVRKPGFTEVHSGLWPRDRAKGKFMEVCKVTVTKEDLEEKPVELSEAEQKKLANKEAEWARLFGEPASVLATDQDIEICLVKTAEGSTQSYQFAPKGRSAQEAFSQLLAGKPAPATPQKPSLAERCRLETLDGFIDHVTKHNCSVEVNPRDFVPAYVTRLETANAVLKSNFAVNAYHRKNELPQLPRCDEQSTVRFDETWGVQSRAAVVGFAKINNQWFMVMQNAHLPTDPSWPLGAGMYPTQLTPEAHHHRSKWASFNSMMSPSIPETGLPLIGSALVGFPSFRFIMNGRQMSVRSQ